MSRNIISLFALILAAPAICLGTSAYSAPTPASKETLVVAGGCFWGVEAVFQHTKGVISATSGYAGGKAETAHYGMVTTGETGHAESVEITYDPNQVSLEQLLAVFFTVAHNPTQLNYQGPDHGTQYRSAVFYSSSAQQKAVARYIETLKFPAPVVTTLEPLEKFYPAEDYHQNYAELHPYNPYIMLHDAPKINALEKQFPELYIK